MSSLLTKTVNTVTKIVSKFTGLSQEETERESIEKTVTPGMPALLRRAAAEGAVLLKNNGVLPLAHGTTVSLFGRVQLEWFYTGYGSGGDVNKPYAVNLADGIRACAELKLNETLAEKYAQWNAQNPIDHGFWAHWPRFYPEMPLSEAQTAQAAANSDCAVVSIGRSSGEDRENTLEKGSFYLTDEERSMLSLVTTHFQKTVVLLNIGSIMDLSWIDTFGDKLGAVLLVWQGGMESGNAAADLLCGKISPCGKLTDTVAKGCADYPAADNFGAKAYNCYCEDIYVGYRWFETFAPDRVLYPFGYGLSYTDFSIQFETLVPKADGFTLSCRVENTGTYSGKEVVQVYLEKPCGRLGNPSKILAGFTKTGLLAPGASESVSVWIPMERLSSYDSAGDTGYKSAYVVEAGNYGFFLGGDVRNAGPVWRHTQTETTLFEQLSEAAAPREAFTIWKAVEKNGKRVAEQVPVVLAATNLKTLIQNKLPAAVAQTGDKGYKLADVGTGKVSMRDFVAQLSLDELEAISRGDYTMNSALGTPGNAGVYGGVLPSLRDKGVPPVTATDGPSGIRLQSCCSLLPIGTLLACTFDEALVCAVYELAGNEMLEKGSDVLLAPGINIHRSPLCGRNFEYFSEDPYLTGKIAAAVVRGVQKSGVSACPKHFACNNQEYHRKTNDSRLSERALREIYLKAFEICVKEAMPQNIMTSYNKINGVHGCYQYELCSAVLRREWGYTGCVMTDWWMQPLKSPEFPKLRGNAYRVRAQVDVLMPGGNRVGKKKSDGTLLKSYGKPDGITLGEMQRCAENVLRFALHSPAMKRIKK